MANGAWKGGRWVGEAAANRRELAELMRQSRALMQRLEEEPSAGKK